MRITPILFDSYLKCPTKCWLKAAGEPNAGTSYSEWLQSQNQSYCDAAVSRLMADRPTDECSTDPPAKTLKTAQWRLALGVTVASEACSSRGNEAQTLSPPSPERDSTPNDQSLLTSAATIIESRLHAVERVPSEGRGKPAHFVPIRFVFRNKLTKDDKLLLAFDAFVLSLAIGREISLGKFIHGDLRDRARGSRGNEAPSSFPLSSTPDTQPSDQSLLTSAATYHAGCHSEMGEPQSVIPAASRPAQPWVTKVKTAALAGAVRKRLEKIIALLSSPTPPDLVLIRHCAECEFRDRCRKIAVEKDDLSLLAGMNSKERQKLRSKGIFTVTQLSYTFRPRRRPKRMRDKREKYHHALKALAIREKKIHIVGSPVLKIEGTPVYLDVEGLPDRDFYYLIGLRIGHGDSAVQHSLWADSVEDEGRIWREFLAILETVEKPVLIHYGSYETNFSKQMTERHGSPQAESVAAKAISSALNLVSVMFATIYFPTFSNGLKEIGGWLGFAWSETKASGLYAILWRHIWEMSNGGASREQLIGYNAEDCQALEIIANAVTRNEEHPNPDARGNQNDVVSVESIKSIETMWPKFRSPISEFEHVNKTARWNYQRDRIYVRSSKRIRRAAERKKFRENRLMPLSKIAIFSDRSICPDCGSKGVRHLEETTRVLHDILFGKTSMKRWVVEYRFRYHWCPKCKHRFGQPKNCWRETKFGRNLVAYVLYQSIELHIPQMTVKRGLHRLFGYDLHESAFADFKNHAAEYYGDTVKSILDRIRQGRVVHVDETRANVRGKTAYVWIFTNLHEVAYLYSDSREGDLLRLTLANFSGVLVSDFYSVYDAMPCPQQKCLLHLIRDLNAEVLNHPFDNEVKGIVTGFAGLLTSIMGTIDHRGLKRYFLRKHLREVERFYRKLSQGNYQSEAAMKCKERFEKNRDKLFTFLNHDGVPWNNNNAEHAVKAFAALRDVMRGSSTQNGIEDYLVLLSVCQTCVFSGVDFLDFLRSGERDVDAFARRQEKRRGKVKEVLRDADGILRGSRHKTKSVAILPKTGTD